MRLSRFLFSEMLEDKVQTLVKDFAVNCPPPSQAANRKMSEKSVQQALSQLYAQAKDVTAEHRMGVIRRALFAKAFQDELRQLGYPAELVSKITGALTINALTTGKGAP